MLSLEVGFFVMFLHEEIVGIESLYDRYAREDHNYCGC